MTHDEQEHLKQTSYAKAMRHMSKAEKILQKAGTDGGFYIKIRHVRTACKTAYDGVLIALDAWLELNGVQKPKKPKHASIRFYEASVAKIDRLMFNMLHSAYLVLFLSGYYEGMESANIILRAFENAHDIISSIKPEHELLPEEIKKPSWLQRVAAVFM